MKIEEKDREAILQFRREEAEKNRQHEKEMAHLYLRMMTQQTTNAIPQTPITPQRHNISSCFPAQLTLRAFFSFFFLGVCVCVCVCVQPPPEKLFFITREPLMVF